MGTKSVNFTLAEEDHKKVDEAKEELEETWEEFVINSAEERIEE